VGAGVLLFLSSVVKRREMEMETVVKTDSSDVPGDTPHVPQETPHDPQGTPHEPQAGSHVPQD
jgi:hypothetical protein